MTAPILTGFGPLVTFVENTVNATPQVLDAAVTFTDPDGTFAGGRLTVTGLLAEDIVSVMHVGTGVGEIGLDAGYVSYGNLAIGVLSGGAGGDLVIDLNSDATTAAIQALIQSLTYANTSNTPTASRDLFINVTDADNAN
jgi:hypothetical protein